MRKKIQPEEPPPEWPEKVEGGKFARMLQRYTRSLREEGAHGNRRLFLDDVVIAYLLAFYNPTLRSLRTIEDFSQTRQAQRHLSVRRSCKSTLSDFNRLADPTVLEPLIHHPRTTAAGRRAPGFPADLPQTLGKVLAVDGSFFSVAADVAWAVRRGAKDGQAKAGARLDVHLDIATWPPEVIDVSGRDKSEAEHAAQHIQPGAIHVYDRGIFSFELASAQQKAGAFFVHRFREPGTRSPKFAAGQPRLLTPQDEAAGVIRLLTNLFDVEAWVIGLLYRSRWQVELFFRWLKCFANFSHLIRESRSGVLLSFYVAVIGVLAMYLQLGVKPSKYAFSLLGLVAQGGATLDEIAPILRERERRIALDRASLARRKNKKK